MGVAFSIALDSILSCVHFYAAHYHFKKKSITLLPALWVKRKETMDVYVPSEYMQCHAQPTAQPLYELERPTVLLCRRAGTTCFILLLLS